jgi:hypothetical protein
MKENIFTVVHLVLKLTKCQMYVRVKHAVAEDDGNSYD